MLGGATLGAHTFRNWAYNIAFREHASDHTDLGGFLYYMIIGHLVPHDLSP